MESDFFTEQNYPNFEQMGPSITKNAWNGHIWTLNHDILTP